MSEKGLRAEPVRAVPEEKKIRNRDILLLSRIFYTMADITSLEQRRTWQRERMFSMTQNLSGMPRGGSGRGGTDNALAALETLDERQAMLVRSYTRELHEVERILNGIPSRTMRSFVLMMYVDQLPHTTVRAELNMTEYGFNRAREAVEQAADMASVVWREKFILEADQNRK